MLWLQDAARDVEVLGVGQRLVDPGLHDFARDSDAVKSCILALLLRLLPPLHHAHVGLVVFRSVCWIKQITSILLPYLLQHLSAVLLRLGGHTFVVHNALSVGIGLERWPRDAVESMLYVHIAIRALIVEYHVFVGKLEIAHHFFFGVHHMINEFLNLLFIILQKLLRCPLALVQFDQVLLG